MNTLRILASILTLVVLAALIIHTDVMALGQSLSRMSWAAIILCLSLTQAQIVLSALRWRFTSQRLGQEIGLLIAIREYYVASFLNQTLPGGMGGDAIRAWRMRGDEPGGWKRPAKAVMFERLSGQIAFFLLAAVGLCLWPSVAKGDGGQHAQLTFFLGSVSVALAGIVVYVVKRKGGFGASLRENILHVFIRRKAWLFQFAASLGILSTYVGIFFIAAQGTGSDLPFIACLTIIPFCMVAMLIPTGFGGWGTREAAAMVLWPMLGAAPLDGLAASTAYGALSLAGTAPGAIFLAINAFTKRPSHA